jgi:hypothetical protein
LWLCALSAGGFGEKKNYGKNPRIFSLIVIVHGAG